MSVGGQSTHTNTQKNNLDNTSINNENNPEETVVDDDNDKVLPVLENQHGLKSMNLPNTKETEDAEERMYLPSETPEPVNTNLQDTDLDGGLGKYITCTIF